MSATGLDVFDKTLHKTHSWLNDLMKTLGWQDKHRAYSALRLTLHALRDRLTVQEAAQLGAQFPLLIRGIYFEGWDPNGKPLKERHKAQFLAHIESAFPEEVPFDAEEVARAVFQLLDARISEGEIQDVRHVLPTEIQELWP
jgi:uncharacterized protein (DUF2267 family)